MAALKLFLGLCLVHTALAKVSGSEAQVECTPEIMKVTVPMDGERKEAYLDQLKGYNPCLPQVSDKSAVFVLDLLDPTSCAITKVLNKITEARTFYHKINVESFSGSKEVMLVRCSMSGTKRRAREVFPLDNFDEPDVLNITRYEEGKAPEPILGAVVKQNGKQVSGEISVTPGTPLSMEIFLNEKSAPVYGLLVNYMHVTDTGKQQETIIFNGCSVDPYLFDNFVTSDGDVLTAKFRAFKFPDSTYVQFKGTVTVCLDKCQGVQCSNGVVGYGRRRRAIAPSSEGNLYEVSVTTFIKVDFKDGDREAEDVHALWKNLKVANQRLGDHDGTPATVAEQTQGQKPIYHIDGAVLSKAHSEALASIVLMVVSLGLLLFK